ncbi:MAG: D-tagatose-bisphosphate aldolase, class II, non-catalytic subunit [Anaerolineales bacterium]|nr:D-tagatose-bisphosphate aldolase, class II, non-catalytic subunit [Anaerolineales bacterium]
MILDDIVSAQKNGEPRGITSICSAHPTVLETCFLHAQEQEPWVLIESTCNQVNQFGGYTGMKPLDFVAFIREMAARLRFPVERVILGGDHLGPEVWQAEPARAAMDKAHKLVRDYVRAGYLKIHLDASMKLGDDPDGPLSKTVSAARAAELAQTAEEAFAMLGGLEPPRYVIGTEVPVPGGAREKEAHPSVTTVTDAAETLDVSRQAFLSRGLEAAWERVIGLVVQPGVEYGDDFILDYDPSSAAALAGFIEGEKVVYEAHSTDYQAPEMLRRMVADHFAILKVGPALTFAYREAIFSLARMESELYPAPACSNLIAVLDRAMAEKPTYWQKYYRGGPQDQGFARKYSYSDRARYYWPDPRVQSALAQLFSNLGNRPVPLSLVSQYLPGAYWRIREGRLANNPQDVTQDKIARVLQDYHRATQA